MIDMLGTLITLLWKHQHLQRSPNRKLPTTAMMAVRPLPLYLMIMTTAYMFSDRHGWGHSLRTVESSDVTIRLLIKILQLQVLVQWEVSVAVLTARKSQTPMDWTYICQFSPHLNLTAEISKAPYISCYEIYSKQKKLLKQQIWCFVFFATPWQYLRDTKILQLYRKCV